MSLRKVVLANSEIPRKINLAFSVKLQAAYLQALRFNVRKNWTKYDVLRDLVPLAQFKKHGKHPCRSVTFGEVASFAQRITNVLAV